MQTVDGLTYIGDIANSPENPTSMSESRGGADWSNSCTRCNKTQAVAIDIIQSNKKGKLQQCSVGSYKDS